MDCKSQSRLLYCWFISPNGTTYSLIPNATNENYEFIGNSLTNGDCGMRIKSASISDMGLWRCNMGTNTVADNRTDFLVQVHKTPLVAKRKILGFYDDVLWCETYNNASLEYCRFIRPDGQGIYPIKGSDYYSDEDTNLSEGRCQLKLKTSLTSNVGTWICAAKSKQSDVEYYDSLIVENFYLFVIYPNGLVALAWIMFVITTVMLGFILAATIHKRRAASRRSQNPPPYSSSIDNELPEKVPLP
ncbi:uncharacterized protein LOC143914387 isoform X2 [Arctopsyche grandis]